MSGPDFSMPGWTYGLDGNWSYSKPNEGGRWNVDKWADVFQAHENPSLDLYFTRTEAAGYSPFYRSYYYRLPFSGHWEYTDVHPEYPVSEYPLKPEGPPHPDYGLPDPKQGFDPWVGGGPGTPGWDVPPFFPEYNKSTAVYSMPPRLSWRRRHRRRRWNSTRWSF